MEVHNLKPQKGKKLKFPDVSFNGRGRTLIFFTDIKLVKGGMPSPFTISVFVCLLLFMNIQCIALMYVSTYSTLYNISYTVS